MGGFMGTGHMEDWNSGKVDMHCHILPGVDDGPATWEGAVAMARAAVAAGVTRLVATPHYLEGQMSTSPEGVLALVTELNQRVADAGIPLYVLPGTEAYLSPGLPELARAGRVLTVNNGGRYILIELPSVELPSWTDEVLFRLRVEGFTPIIAHPERNCSLQRDPSPLYRWVEGGVLAQVDAGSLLGRYGPAALRTARLFIENHLVRLAGSDCHSPDTPQLFGALPSLIAALVARDRPGVVEAVLYGEEVPPLPTAPPCQPFSRTSACRPAQRGRTPSQGWQKGEGVVSRLMALMSRKG